MIENAQNIAIASSQPEEEIATIPDILSQPEKYLWIFLKPVARSKLPFCLTMTLGPLLVEANTGIFCSTCASLTGHVSRRIFDRRIDLDWFQDVQIELTRSNFKKTDFWVKNRPFLEFF